MVLVTKLKIFHFCLLGKIEQKNVFKDILNRCFLDYKNKEFKKVEKLGFFKKGWFMVLVKNLKIFHLFPLSKISQKNVFHDLLETKKAFLGHKNKNLK